MRSKKAVTVFTIDAIVAATILIAGIILVFFRLSVYQPLPEPGLQAGNNIMSFLSTTTVGDLGGMPGAVDSNTILQQVADFYHQGKESQAVLLLGTWLPRIETQEVDFIISVDGNPVYNSGVTAVASDASIVIPFKKIVYGTSGKGNFWSYIVEVKVWQR